MGFILRPGRPEIIDKYEEEDGVTEVTVPDSVDTVYDHAFKGCCHLKKIILPETMDFIGVHAFEGCTSLQQIVMPSGRNNKVYMRGCTFCDCTSLVSINLPEKLRALGDNCFGLAFNVFENCKSLQNISIPEGYEQVTGFQNCTSLTRIRLPDSVRFLKGDAFWGCTNLREISLPASVQQIDAKAFPMGSTVLFRTFKNTLRLHVDFFWRNKQSENKLLNFLHQPVDSERIVYFDRTQNNSIRTAMALYMLEHAPKIDKPPYRQWLHENMKYAGQYCILGHDAEAFQMLLRYDCLPTELIDTLLDAAQAEQQTEILMLLLNEKNRRNAYQSPTERLKL